MKKKLLLLLLVPIFIICGSFFSSKKSVDPSPEVLVTIAPYKYFIEKLTDSSIRVKNLVPEQADPHGFSPPAKELIPLFSAKAWFLIGEPFEDQFLPIIQRNDPNLKVVHLKPDLDHKLKMTCSHHHGIEDMHFWMSPQIMKQQVNQIALSLKDLYPEKASLIENRLIEINQEFDQLHQFMVEKTKSITCPYLLVSHPAFGYFCQDYNLEQLALENEAQDPSAKEIAILFDQIKEKDIKKIYVQKQHSYKTAKLTADSLNLQMIEVNPYKEDYFQNMKQFGNQLGDS